MPKLDKKDESLSPVTTARYDINSISFFLDDVEVPPESRQQQQEYKTQLISGYSSKSRQVKSIY